MKKFIVSAFALLATVVCFNSCSGEDVEEKLTFTLELKSTEDGVQTFGGKDSDGDYLTMLVNEEAKTYELFWGESKKAENFEEFSTGTFTIEAGLSDDKVMKCSDNDGETKFDLIVKNNGKKLVKE